MNLKIFELTSFGYVAKINKNNVFNKKNKMNSIYKICIVAILSFISISAFSQKTSNMEVKTFTEQNGLIVISAYINGFEGKFLLDLSGEFSLTHDFATKAGIEFDENNKSKIKTFSFGDNVYTQSNTVTAANGANLDYLKQNNLDGFVNKNVFSLVVLTIDKVGKRIITTLPHRPAFINLTERTDFAISADNAIDFTINVNGNPLNVSFDTRIPSVLTTKDQKVKSPATISFVNVTIKDNAVNVDSKLKQNAVVGIGMLDYGIVSIDFQKQKIYFQSYDATKIVEEPKSKLKELVPGKLNAITKDEFLAYIYDYKNNPEFTLKSKLPVVVDFWASWCGPCMKLLPTMEKMAEKYKDQVIFCKVNSDEERELTSVFKIQALPTLFFIPVGGKPIVDVGALPEKYQQIIEQQLLKK